MVEIKLVLVYNISVEWIAIWQEYKVIVMSNVKMSIEDKKYLYEQPWFYNNKLALRCELGVGNGMKYLKMQNKEL